MGRISTKPSVKKTPELHVSGCRVVGFWFRVRISTFLELFLLGQEGSQRPQRAEFRQHAFSCRGIPGMIRGILLNEMAFEPKQYTSIHGGIPEPDIRHLPSFSGFGVQEVSRFRVFHILLALRPFGGRSNLSQLFN